MNVSDNKTSLLATILIALGAVFLLGNLGWFPAFTSLIWGFILLTSSLGFFALFYRNRKHWWALIPGFALLPLGLGALWGDIAGSLFLAAIGSAFLMIYLSNREHWWAIIPAGGTYTIAVIAWMDTVMPFVDGGWIFFLGIALTFAVLFWLPENKQRWAIYPSLGALGLMLVSFLGTFGSWVLPAALLISGTMLILRGKRKALVQEF